MVSTPFVSVFKDGADTPASRFDALGPLRQLGLAGWRSAPERPPGRPSRPPNRCHLRRPGRSSSPWRPLPALSKGTWPASCRTIRRMAAAPSWKRFLGQVHTKTNAHQGSSGRSQMRGAAIAWPMPACARADWTSSRPPPNRSRYHLFNCRKAVLRTLTEMISVKSSGVEMRSLAQVPYQALVARRVAMYGFRRCHLARRRPLKRLRTFLVPYESQDRDQFRPAVLPLLWELDHRGSLRPTFLPSIDHSNNRFNWSFLPLGACNTLAVSR